jgi:hypothetical protein
MEENKPIFLKNNIGSTVTGNNTATPTIKSKQQKLIQNDCRGRFLIVSIV